MLHRLIDPLLALPNQWKATAALRNLPDGEYTAVPDVPYVPQFASPDLIREYIHAGLHGRDDPHWPTFGAPDADTYTFWAHRACAIACLKMAVDAFHSAPPESLWSLTEAGIALNGYLTRDAAGNLIDMGWFYEPLVSLAAQRGLTVRGMGYASLPDVCAAIRGRWLVAAAVTPELGEPAFMRGARPLRYDGHFALVYGFRWQGGRCTALLLHNPSGRSAELQKHAVVPAERFYAAYAYRFIAYCKADR
jgi:hypothetical protein